MADMAAISQVLSSIKAATDIAKLLKETNTILGKGRNQTQAGRAGRGLG